ncbi:hypothetical protein BS47DRAFT_1287756 [Hydnum rufescens UP504]|uniref:L-serine ammonia-lyase n=1 Tax=Hydnum rufescens UP504 TaxID=1448309 RepID=A0A9P6B9J4_9AGAM|nr:hypothetical protein BS47DRAFT_1287756 [Hydnum rufescens UP504]
MALTNTVLWHQTPLLHSESITSRLGCDVYLKLEIFQPSQSFKYRGQAFFVQEALKQHGPDVHLVIASSGNAALALAHVCQTLHVKCTVFLPSEAAKKNMLDTLDRLAVNLIVVPGEYYADALVKAMEFVATDKNIVLAPTYDHPALWKGISSMISEVAEQLPKATSPPDAIVCSVGGGSMLTGTLLGCAEQGWDDVHVVALETQGADAFYHSVLSTESASFVLPRGITTHVSPEHEITIATLPEVTSCVTSLGATSSAGTTIKMAVERRASGHGGLTCVTIPDESSMQTCLDFADDTKLLVELAASTTLTPAYSSVLFDSIFGDTMKPVSGRRRSIVFIVCGGFKISPTDLETYRVHLLQTSGVARVAWVNGRSVPLS